MEVRDLLLKRVQKSSPLYQHCQEDVTEMSKRTPAQNHPLRKRENKEENKVKATIVSQTHRTQLFIYIYVQRCPLLLCFSLQCFSSLIYIHSG